MSARADEGVRTTLLSVAVNVVLAVAKFAVGLVANSAALVADGIHSLVDLVSDIAALVGLRFADLPKDEDHPYGHHRINTVATLVISCLVLAFCVGLGWHSAAALIAGAVTEVPGVAAAWVAALGLRMGTPAVLPASPAGAPVRPEPAAAPQVASRADRLAQALTQDGQRFESRVREVTLAGAAARPSPVQVVGARPADTIGGSYRRPVATRRRGGA